MRRLLFVFLILLFIGAGGWAAYRYYWLPREQAKAQPAYETFTLQRGSIASTVSATGNIEPAAEIALTFRSAGRVDKVLVTAGERVQQGQLLAELDSTDFTLALAQAKVSLEISQAQLTKLTAPPDPKDVAAAQAAVEVAQVGVAGAEAALNSAQASYRNLLAGPSTAQKTVNLAQVRQAEANLRTAQRAFDQVKNQPNIGELPQSTQLEQSRVKCSCGKPKATW